MADNNAPAPLIKPLVEARPGDPITAGRWNEMQSLMRSEHVQHSHTGVWKGDLFDGAPITSAGLANGAVTGPRIADRTITGDKIDPATDIKARDITATGALRAAALDLAETEAVVLRAVDLKLGHSTRRQTPGRALTDLSGDTQQLGINADGDWKDGVKIGSALLVSGKTELTDVVTAKSSLTVAGALTAASATISGALTANSGLTVAGAVTIKTGLAVAGSFTATGGLTVSGAVLTASNGLAVTGSLTATGGLTVSGAPLTASNGLTVAGGFTASGGLTVGGAVLTVNAGLTVGGGVTTVGHITVNGTLSTTNGPSLSCSSGFNVGGALNVLGNATVKGRSVATVDGITAPRIVCGHVRHDGGAIYVRSNTSFSVEAMGTNYCKITLTQNFPGTPVFIVQQVGDGKTTDNALVQPDGYGWNIFTGNASGDRERRSFYFIIIGEQG